MSIVKNMSHCAWVGGVTSAVFLAVSAAPAQAAAIPVGAVATYEAITGAWVEGGTWNGTGAWVEAPAGNEFRSSYWDGRYRVPIYSFQLPALAAGEHVVSVKVSLPLMWKDGGVAHNLDLDAINVTSSGGADHSYYQAPGVQIADNFMSPSMPDPDWLYVETNAAQSDVFGAWLDANYAADSFVNLRLKWDAAPPHAPDAYHLGTKNYSGFSPYLVLTTVPEPATLGLVAAGGMLLLRRRDRQA